MDDGSHYRHLQQTPQSSIMGALGGALSGLLSRSKYAASPGRVPSSYIPSSSSSSSSAHLQYRSSQPSDRESINMPASLRAQLDLTSSPVPGHSSYHRTGNIMANDFHPSNTITNEDTLSAEDQQPYHRVVSAPPGRIGVTFVEFRGHAMVSDVAMDSPLSGWVFPSDVLIAVDEIPVSGMRVRDIVKILANRKDRQRAMRVISSHAMNEFTMSQGALNEEDGEDE
jgi:C-terminal processing protease CtpA/Prc